MDAIGAPEIIFSLLYQFYLAAMLPEIVRVMTSIHGLACGLCRPELRGWHMTSLMPLAGFARVTATRRPFEVAAKLWVKGLF